MRLPAFALVWTLGCASTHPADGEGGPGMDAAEGDAEQPLDASRGGDAGGDADADGDADLGCPTRPACAAPDADCDVHDAIEAGGDDCNDADPSTYPGAPDGDWTFETVGDYPGVNAGGLAMAWDALAGPVFAWASWGTEWDGQIDPVRVASLVEDGWRIETPDVPADESRPWCCSIVAALVDGCGAVVVGFARSTNSAEAVLHVLRGLDGAWVDEIVDDGAFESYGPLVLASGGIPHAIYMSDDLRHARRQADGTWASERIDDRGYRPAVAVDATGHFHVSYATPLNTPTEVRYATNASGEWTVTTLWSDGPVDLETAVAVDSDRVPTVLYHDYADRGLVATTRGNDGWSESIVDADGSGNFAAAADDAGVVHVAYQVQRNLASKERIGSELRHAWSDAGAWSTELVSFDSLYSSRFPNISVGQGATVRIGFEVYEEPSTVHLALGNAAGDGIDQDCDGIAE